ncbi:MAG: UDP-2,4-diacetamido-2,4,6-trideoxy-beta-L-altropyranose hydrolase [Gemmatimonadetes bacterium]|nr:UDP-2,4-diacetamido-2,4,6-trideoxy-beta-L-altropyranose hydrolase [Gemmatimonadota bacterium]
MPDHLTIRADGDAEIGVGHLVRCYALAQAWKRRGGRVTLVTKRFPDRLPEWDGQERIELGNVVAEADLGTTLAAGDGWVVVDGYHFDKTYLCAIHAAGRPLLVIDDTIRLDYYPVTALLNPSPGFSKADFVCPPNAATLLGPNYAMLRGEVLQARTPQENPSEQTRILVTMGGSDPRCLTRIVLEGILLLDPQEFKTQVILGPSNPSHREISSLAEGRDDIEILLSPADFPHLASRADIAITAAGSTCWELAYLGTPSLTVTAADNQRPIASAVDRAGAGESLGDGSLLAPRELSDRVVRLAANPDRLARMGSAGQRLVDGSGAERVVSRLQEHPS